MTNKEFRNQYKTNNWKCDGNKSKNQNYDIAAYPFGAEEMLLIEELKKLKEDNVK